MLRLASCQKPSRCQKNFITAENSVAKICLRQLTADALEKLKLKSIEDFKKLIKQISYGYRPSYRNLLNQICFIEVHSQLDNSELIYEQYINNELQ